MAREEAGENSGEMGGFRTMNPQFMLTIIGIIFMLPTPGFGHALNPGVLEFNPRGDDIFFQWSPPEPATSDPVPGQEPSGHRPPQRQDHFRWAARSAIRNFMTVKIISLFCHIISIM